MSKRITVPEGKLALIVSRQFADELFCLAKALSSPSRKLFDRLNQSSTQDVADELLLTLARHEDSFIDFTKQEAADDRTN